MFLSCNNVLEQIYSMVGTILLDFSWVKPQYRQPGVKKQTHYGEFERPQRTNNCFDLLTENCLRSQT